MERGEAFIKTLFDLEGSSEKVYKKGDFLIEQGKVEYNIYLIVSGAVRAYRSFENEEQTIRLGYQGSIITSIASFYNGAPSEISLEAIRKTYVKKASRSSFMQYVKSSSEHLETYNSLLESLVVSQMEREMDLLTEQPHERLARVLTRSPKLFQEIPLKYIASYLRMSPETLSRIRKQM